MANILLMEDDEDVCSNVAEILSLANHNVSIARNGLEGIEKAYKEPYDLILSDISMPCIDGFGVLHILRKEDKARNIPFIFLSSKKEAVYYRQAMHLGADDYIAKPFEAGDLLKAIDQRLRQANKAKDEIKIPQAITRPDEFRKITRESDIISLLTDGCDETEYHKKQIIYKEGSPARNMYYIKSGKIKTYKSHEDGKDLIVGLHGEGDFIGYVPLIKGHIHLLTAEAIEDCKLVVIPKSRFDEVANTHTEVMKKFIGLMADELQDKEQQVLNFAYNTLRKKVAKALASFEKKFHIHENEAFTIDLTRNDLASIAGTATESLIRTLTEFKQEKLIDMKDGHITILNKNRLNQLVR